MWHHEIYVTRNLGCYVPLFLAPVVSWYVSWTGGRPVASRQSIFVWLVKWDLLKSIVVFLWGGYHKQDRAAVAAQPCLRGFRYSIGALYYNTQFFINIYCTVLYPLLSQGLPVWPVPPVQAGGQAPSPHATGGPLSTQTQVTTTYCRLYSTVQYILIKLAKRLASGKPFASSCRGPIWDSLAHFGLLWATLA